MAARKALLPLLLPDLVKKFLKLSEQRFFDRYRYAAAERIMPAKIDMSPAFDAYPDY